MNPTSEADLAVCFDATGTLIETTRPVGETYRRVALEYGVDLPAWRIEDAFRRILKHAPPRGLEGATPADRRRSEFEWWVERIRQTFQATDSTARFPDFPAFATALFEIYRAPEAWRLRPGALEILQHLDRLEVSTGLLSNFDHRLPEILQGLEISSFFDVILIPSETGLRKPDRRLFELAADAFDCPLGRMVYVGDDEPAVLEAIGDHGLRVIDVKGIGGLERIPDLITRIAIVPPPPEESASKER